MRQSQILGCVGGHVLDQEVRRRRYHQGAHGDQHQQLLGLEQLAYRCLAGFAIDERGGFFTVAADVNANRADQQAEQERQAPAPIEHLFRAQAGRQHVAEQRRQHGSQPLAGELQAGDKTASLWRGMLDQVGRRTAKFTTGRKALQQARNEDSNGGQKADGAIGGDTRDDQGTGEHQADGNGQ
ncbi:hypothetical protein D3C81_1215160 [compost metagenome]